ncbi:gastrula zinc finger protein XlCGF17.1-like isoform X2 [Periplaneta americana]|uniref:gastrula zinc finger protein XlCGF17.1-like isoform X2 n=1 Tax=Periplaneta americana TaxID=6978 RepID=UPI0037E77FFE
MDVIKMEPEFDPLAIQKFDNTEIEKKKPFSEEGNLLHQHVTEIKTESKVHNITDPKSEMTFGETPVPIEISIVKSEVTEEASGADQVDEEFKWEVTAEENEVLTESIAATENNGMPSYCDNIAQDGDRLAGKKRHKCNVCGKCFLQLSNLKTHSGIHTGRKPYRCDVCGKDFSLLGYLRKHAKVHTGEKPFSCNVCGKNFSLSGNLRKHGRIHTGEKPFTCDVCGKNFSQWALVKKHASVHTGEKPFSCIWCGKNFSQSGNLKVHSRLHTGEKPFKCDVCDKSFTFLGSLNIHLHTHK